METIIFGESIEEERQENPPRPDSVISGNSPSLPDNHGGGGHAKKDFRAIIKKANLSRKIPIIAIVLLSAAILLYRLDRYPVNIGPYEGIAGVAAIKIAEGDVPTMTAALNRSQQPLYGSRGTAWNPFLVYPMAVVYRLVGFALIHIGIRLVPVIYGVLSVAAMYLLIGGMFGPRAGLASAFLLATSSWFLSLSRLCSDFSAAIFYSIFCLLVYSRTGRKGKTFISHILLGGILALGSYFYLPARVIAAVVFVAIILRCIFDRGYLRTKWLALIVMLLSFQAACYLQGLDGISYFTSMHERRGNEIFWNQSKPPVETLMFHCEVFYNAFFTKWGWTGSSIAYERQISLDPVSRWLILVAVFLSILRIRNHKYRFLLIWVLISPLPMILSNARGKRGLLVIPAFCALAAVGMCGVIDMLSRWSKEFKAEPGRIWRVIGSIMIMLILLYIGMLNLENYFGEYAKAEPKLLTKSNKFPQWDQLIEILKTNDLYTDCWLGESADTGEYLARCIGREEHFHLLKADEARKQFNEAEGPAVLFLNRDKKEERK